MKIKRICRVRRSFRQFHSALCRFLRQGVNLTIGNFSVGKYNILQVLRKIRKTWRTQVKLFSTIRDCRIGSASALLWRKEGRKHKTV